MRADLRYLFASVAATAAFTFFALAFPNVTRTFTLPGAIACFILTVYFIWPEIRDLHKSRRKRVIALVGMIVCAICFAGFAAFYFWPDKTEAVSDASPLDGSLQISCENSAYPTVVPPNRMYELQLNNRFMKDGGTFIWWTFPAGTTLPPRDQATSPIDGQRCRISNYGKMAIINAQVTFPVDFRTVEKMENGTRSGDIQKSAAVTTPLFSIGPGEFVDLYAMNYSTDTFAELSIPSTARGFAPGSDKIETFKLIPPFLAGTIIPPFTPIPQLRCREASR